MFGGALVVGSPAIIVFAWYADLLAIVAIIRYCNGLCGGCIGAKYTGASKTAVWGALSAASSAHSSLFPAYCSPVDRRGIGEFIIARKDTWQAGKVGIGTFIGFIIGTVAKIGCALTIALTILFVWLASFF